MSRVLIIGDTHCPFELPGYLRHCKKVRDQYGCDKVVHIGDEVDLHAISYHETDPDGWSAGHEYEAACKALKPWFRAFPNVKVCIGNHSARMFRKAFSAGIPAKMLKGYREMWGAPRGWQWVVSTEIDGVLYTHKPGRGAKHATAQAPSARRQSIVFGHIHAHAGVAYQACERDLIFGMNVGCGIDVHSYSQKYAMDFPDKPCIGCGVVINGRVAHWVPMDLGTKYPA